MDDAHVPEDRRCSCASCRVRNDDFRANAVFWFAVAALLVASVWAGIRLGIGLGLSVPVVLATVVGIAVAAGLLCVLISWRKPCVSKGERETIEREWSERTWRAMLEGGEVTQDEFDEQAKLGFPPGPKGDFPDIGTSGCVIVLLILAILLVAAVALVAWLITFIVRSFG